MKEACFLSSEQIRSLASRALEALTHLQSSPEEEEEYDIGAHLAHHQEQQEGILETLRFCAVQARLLKDPSLLPLLSLETPNLLSRLLWRTLFALLKEGLDSPGLKVIELHGTNRAIECLSCQERSLPAPAFASFRQTRRPPRCPCGGLLKPATISFGQSLRPQDLRANAGNPERRSALRVSTPERGGKLYLRCSFL